jgi:hypothetical protein
MFSFPAWNYPGLPGISKQEKKICQHAAAGIDPLTFWILSKCLTSTSPILISKLHFFAKNNILLYDNNIAD